MAEKVNWDEEGQSADYQYEEEFKSIAKRSRIITLLQLLWIVVGIGFMVYWEAPGWSWGLAMVVIHTRRTP